MPLRTSPGPLAPGRTRRRRRSGGLAVVAALVAGSGLAGGSVLAAGTADAAPGPAVSLWVPQAARTLARVPGDPAFGLLDGIYLAAPLGRDLEVRATRRSYAEPVRGTLVTGPRERRREVPLPDGLVGMDGLHSFLQVRVTSRAGRVVTDSARDVCLAGAFSAARTGPDSPDTWAGPQDCPRHPFTVGAVHRVPGGWATPAPGFDGSFDEPDALRVPDGTYTVTMTIRPAWRTALGLTREQATASTRVVVVRGERGGGGIGGELAASAPAGRTSADGAEPAARRLSSQDLPAHDDALHAAHGHLAGPHEHGTAATSPSAAPQPEGRDDRRFPGSVRPDLRALPAFGVEFVRPEDAEAMGGEPGHDYLAFAATVWNGGGGPLVVDGFRRPSADVMDAYQYFYDRSGRRLGYVPTGTMQYDPRPGHEHWHFTDFATYRLLSADKRLAVRSEKEAFCLAPTDAVDLTLPGVDYDPGDRDLRTACGFEGAVSIREVLAAGWGDTYGQYLPGQSFDVTDLPNGTYWIEVLANPEGNLVETTRTNNSALRKIVLGGTTGARTVTVPPVGLVTTP